jgi:DNA-binding transcriptional LysR family regulator
MADVALTELTAMAAVAAHRSFRAAAVELDMSPSSLSHAIAGMERRLGVRLFNRTTRSVSLTEAGEHFLARVGPALRDIKAAVESVNRFRDTPAGLLRLNTSEVAARRILPIVLDFMALYPDMRVDLVSEGRMIDIVAAGFDAGLRLADSVPQEMVSVPMGRDEEFAVVGTPAYFEGRTLPRTPADLLAHECVRARMPSGGIYRWEFERFGDEMRIDVSGRLILGNHELALEAARMGAGLAYATLASVSKELEAGSLIRALADWTPPFPGLCLYYPRQRLPSAGLKAFIEHFQRARKR